MAQFPQLRHNRASSRQNGAMASIDPLLDAIRQAPGGLTLSELLARRPDVSRRTAQRWIQALLRNEQIRALGNGRARRYLATDATTSSATDHQATTDHQDIFPAAIPLSADSRDILEYIDQPLEARKPIGHQREFLDEYEPNKTQYLPNTLRRQLRLLGDTGQTQRPAGTYGRAILSRLLIDLSWASSNLEGNTYSRLDTRELIEHGKSAQGKSAFETQMILNHKAAIELLIESAGTASFSRYMILNLHSCLSENLLPNPADEGRVRQHAVNIGKSVYRPIAMPSLLEELLGLLLDKANRISDPFEQSFFVMVHLPYLQPFADVNKRTSRLAANLPLIRANLCPLTFLDVPERAYNRAILGVYEMARVELLRDLYMWAYERSTQEYLTIKQELVEPDPMRLAYRDVIRQVIHDVVTGADEEPLAAIRNEVAKLVSESDRQSVQALIVEELRRLHEGSLSRYRLRPSDFVRWKERTG